MSNPTPPDIDQAPAAFLAANNDLLGTVKQNYDTAGNLLGALDEALAISNPTAEYGNLIDDLLLLFQKRLAVFADLATIQAQGSDDGWATGDITTIADGNRYRCTGTTATTSTWAALGGAGGDETAIHDDTAGEIAAVALKATPVSADLLLIEDSADSNNKKRATAQTIADLAPAQTKINLQTFTGNGTWTKPAGTTAHSVTRVYAIGAGGGGGSGERRVSLSTDGGRGGAGGGLVIRDFPTSTLGATETVTIGASGAAGAAQAGAGDGNAGGDGGDTIFGSNLVVAKGGLAGEGGNVGTHVYSIATGQTYPGGPGGNDNTTLSTFAGFDSQAGGGGGGGGRGTGGTNLPGGAGGAGGGSSVQRFNLIADPFTSTDLDPLNFSLPLFATSGNGGAGGAAGGTAGTAGAAGSGAVGIAGAGGGGGGGGHDVNGGAGGAGGTPGGGGGGGGGCDDATGTKTSGAGGAGGAGKMWVVTWI